METNDLKSYQIRLHCQECGKFINIDFYIKLNERDQYGKEEEYWPKKLPKYLSSAFLQIPASIRDISSRAHYSYHQHNSLNSITIPGAPQPQPQPTQQLEPLILCQRCINLKKLKE